MKTLSIFEKLYVSISYAEERAFKKFTWRDLLDKWNDIWVAVAFAEGGVDYPEKTNRSKEPRMHCELGDISCFMTRNA